MVRTDDDKERNGVYGFCKEIDFDAVEQKCPIANDKTIKSKKSKGSRYVMNCRQQYILEDACKIKKVITEKIICMEE